MSVAFIIEFWFYISCETLPINYAGSHDSPDDHKNNDNIDTTDNYYNDKSVEVGSMAGNLEINIF